MSQTLTEEQTAAVHRWAEEGADLPQIQKRLDEEFEVRLTFMESRFLIADLGVELKGPEPEPEPEPEAEVDAAPPQDQSGAEGEETDASMPIDGGAPEGAEKTDDADATEGGGVTVTISELQRPGMMANGSVTFAGGEKAEWYLDQTGQLGMNPNSPEFRPSQSDMLAFQKELQRVAQSKGF